MDSNILLSVGLVALLSFNTYHALPTQENDDTPLPSNGYARYLPYIYFGSIYYILDNSFRQRSTTEQEAINEMNEIHGRVVELFGQTSLTVKFSWKKAGHRFDPNKIAIEQGTVKGFAKLEKTDASVYIYLTNQKDDSKNGAVSKEGGICNKDNGHRPAAIVNFKDNVRKTGENVAKHIGLLLGIKLDYSFNRGTQVWRDCVGGQWGLKWGVMDLNTYGSYWSPCSFGDFEDSYKAIMSSNGGFCMRTDAEVRSKKWCGDKIPSCNSDGCSDSAVWDQGNCDYTCGKC